MTDATSESDSKRCPVHAGWVAGSVTSRREGDDERVEGLAEDVSNEQDIDMPDPRPKFKEAIDWCARAVRAMGVLIVEGATTEFLLR